MEHKMKLNNEPFQAIKSGIKKIEIRLNDEKRQQVQSGDEILFTNLVTDEHLKVTVIQTKYYSSFQALLKDYTNQEIGVQEDLQLSQKLAAIYQIYSQTDELDYGALAIKIERIK
ncbi:ASCH domain-containing protein [Staphylococcus gallinarum]|uniref:ASCH domain-containing protein n=1 Tax=Staphylococcus gallinarum TaxID=1293 RepID=A0A3A0VSJ3_STAGA|nr:ASCH domain-containing protein [Staphylococcus gallinarum]RIP37320.1 ASCH domain-containing protein [Staphylococcus gallinarum]